MSKEENIHNSHINATISLINNIEKEMIKSAKEAHPWNQAMRCGMKLIVSEIITQLVELKCSHLVRNKNDNH